MSSQRPTSHSPPPANSSIVNASNLLPSVNVLFDEVRQRERAGSHSSSRSRTPSAWSGFPGPDRGLHGHPHAVLPRPQLPPLQVGPRLGPQAPPSARPGTGYSYSESPEVQAPLPVIPNRMGGRYAQTPCHSNGQPHAPGLINKASPIRPREPHASTVIRVCETRCCDGE
ncbi:hypothetical protein B0H12DRAFT_786374 [Mycena haematopus]|nr:hypothetical protein B0H12DRAFT_786374 [Mycena haematopus]